MNIEEINVKKYLVIALLVMIMGVPASFAGENKVDGQAKASTSQSSPLSRKINALIDNKYKKEFTGVVGAYKPLMTGFRQFNVLVRHAIDALKAKDNDRVLRINAQMKKLNAANRDLSAVYVSRRNALIGKIYQDLAAQGHIDASPDTKNKHYAAINRVILKKIKRES